MKLDETDTSLFEGANFQRDSLVVAHIKAYSWGQSLNHKESLFLNEFPPEKTCIEVHMHFTHGHTYQQL